ncbi:MAG: glycosyltransferase family 2 protein [Thermus sp.]|uniref:glycosyltransferase family 2 protein n=1 Tax=Thermus sp. TaxID=275 RepID=UPI0025D74549|nr:glycosyltransferase family 2 protein [Thermus sp.]MCS6869808.1 glycosyltransferase family 2 protein [Thermus sp.]MCS7217686.1 glycosyltransferase family 2 protein [Thermus sp.]MCX7849176.1 glycosyltransferase family 2 protein [Thermus sp.]
MEATVLIPAYNEEATLAQVVRVAKEAGLPVVVADDGSQDRTAQVAEGAGALVVRLPQNQGKGGAIAAGLKRVATPLVLLLDADLLGLQPEHLQALLEPVVRGEAEMTVGVFQGGRLSTDLAMRLTPFLSGQRALRTEALRGVPGLAGARYDLELLLTRHAKRQGWRVRYLPLPGVSQVMKEEKRGLLPGLWHRLRMYREILRYYLRAQA